MADKAGADRAIKEPNPVIDGRKANVNLAYLGAKPRGPAAGEDTIYGIPLTGVARYPTVIPGQYGQQYRNGYWTTDVEDPDHAGIRHNFLYSPYSRSWHHQQKYSEMLHPAASNYLYHPSAGYIPTTAGLLPITHSHLNPHAAALTAASQQAYFDYTNATAAAAYPGTYQTAAAAATGMEPYAAAVSAASAISPYAAVPGYTWPLPQAATAAAAAAGTIPLSTYPAAAQPQLQEARMQ